MNLCEGLPGNERESAVAVGWISGTRSRTEASGVELVGLVELRADVMGELNKLDRMLLEQLVVRPKDARDEAEKAVSRQIRMNERQLEILVADIRRTKDELWGGTEVWSDE